MARSESNRLIHGRGADRPHLPGAYTASAAIVTVSSVSTPRFPEGSPRRTVSRNRAVLYLYPRHGAAHADLEPWSRPGRRTSRPCVEQNLNVPGGLVVCQARGRYWRMPKQSSVDLTHIRFAINRQIIKVVTTHQFAPFRPGLRLEIQTCIGWAWFYALK